MSDDAAATKSTPKSAFGHQALVDQIVARIQRQFSLDSIQQVEPSLVIGLLGDWGSGKSCLLGQIDSAFEKTLKDNAEANTITIPIRFNPWRFEKEIHLIVPLLKMIEAKLRAVANDEPTSLSQTLLKGVWEGIRFTGIASISFFSMFKIKAGLPGLGSLEVNPDQAISRAAGLLKETEKGKGDGDGQAEYRRHGQLLSSIRRQTSQHYAV